MARARAGGRMSRQEGLANTLQLAAAELVNAARADSLDAMRERVRLARGFVAEALERCRKAGIA